MIPSSLLSATAASSTSDLLAFLDHQHHSCERTKKAFEAGMYVEALYLSIAQLHAVLRKALWVQSQLTAFESSVDVTSDPDLQAMIQDSTDMMPEGVHDRQLYYAAEKFGVLKPDIGKQLAEVFERVKLTLRSLFSDSTTAATVSYDDLREPAKEFLEQVETTIDDLQKQSLLLTEHLENNLP